MAALGADELLSFLQRDIGLCQIEDTAEGVVDCGRKVAFVGRSMRKNSNIARNLGYMEVPENVILRPNELSELPPHEQLILCTGSQGEPMSAMTRIAYNDHPGVHVEPLSRIRDMAAYQGATSIAIAVGPGIGGLSVAAWGYGAPFLLQGGLADLGEPGRIVVPDGPGYNCADVRSDSARHKMFPRVDRLSPDPVVTRFTQVSWICTPWSAEWEKRA